MARCAGTLCLSARRLGLSCVLSGCLDHSLCYSHPAWSLVTQDVNGRPVARIDLGSNDAIRANMKLFISRGDQFLANLIVLDTDLNTAVGAVDTLGQSVKVQPGDRVFTGFN